MHKLREGDNYRLACARVLLEYYILEKDWDCVQFDHTFFRRGGLGGGGGGGRRREEDTFNFNHDNAIQDCFLDLNLHLHVACNLYPKQSPLIFVPL